MQETYILKNVLFNLKIHHFTYKLAAGSITQEFVHQEKEISIQMFCYMSFSKKMQTEINQTREAGGFIQLQKTLSHSGIRVLKKTFCKGCWGYYTPSGHLYFFWCYRKHFYTT